MMSVPDTNDKNIAESRSITFDRVLCHLFLPGEPPNLSIADTISLCGTASPDITLQ